jgi:hypothetical protein
VRQEAKVESFERQFRTERSFESPAKTYFTLLARLTKFAQRSGVTLGASRPGRSYFANLESATQLSIIDNLRTYVDVCEDVIRDGKPLTDDKHFLWRMLLKRRLRPSAGLFELFEDGDIIDVYDMNGFVQIFRNMRFFSVCSYSLDELLCRPWYELYARDERITAGIHATAMTFASRTAQDTKYLDLGEHILEEIDSEAGYRFLVVNRFLSRLTDESGRPTAIVNVARALDQLDPQKDGPRA